MPVLELTDDQVVELFQNISATQQERILARLVKENSHQKRPQFGSAKNDILFIAEDFDAPLEDFKEHME